jgi:hypothetical protein
MKRQGLESACDPNLTTRRGRLAGGSLERPSAPSLVFGAAIVRRSRFTPYQLGVRIDGRLLAGPGESWPPAPRWFAGKSRRNAGYRPSTTGCLLAKAESASRRDAMPRRRKPGGYWVGPCSRLTAGGVQLLRRALVLGESPFVDSSCPGASGIDGRQR